MDVAEVRADLIAEQDALDRIVSALDEPDFALPTPSPRWSIADQLGHLTYFDGTATLAITDPSAFRAGTERMGAAMTGEPDADDDVTLGEYRAMDATALLAAWRANRAALAEAAAGLDNDDRVDWYGPSMGSKSFLTARLMEAWAHGRDIADAAGVEPEPTDRLRHIAQLGFITRGWSYVNRGLEPPPTQVRVELAAPSGATWTFGPDDADDVVRGPAVDFCLVVTQRRNVGDTALAVVGDAAADWMGKAQAFAGPPTDGPAAHRPIDGGADG
jgi:uncharacterized protein (TIGR03084 family)